MFQDPYNMDLNDSSNPTMQDLITRLNNSEHKRSGQATKIYSLQAQVMQLKADLRVEKEKNMNLLKKTAKGALQDMI